jgi:hypothetical protein
MVTKKFAMSLKAKFPILVVMKYSSLHSTFFSVKSKVKPPAVINGAPKNFTALPTTAIRKKSFISIGGKGNGGRVVLETVLFLELCMYE